MKQGLGIIGFIVIMGIGALFGGKTDEVLKYNDAMVDLIDGMNQSFDPFLATVGPYHDGEEVDIDEMDTELEKLVASVKMYKDQIKQLEVPEEPVCTNFHQACLSYINNAQEICVKYDEMVDYMADNNPATQADMAAAEAIVDPLAQRDEQLFQKVISSQETMARKFNFELEY